MSNGKLMKERVWVLVKAYPQPSQQYEETVCCAGISEDGSQILRLFPIRYRRLPREARFERFDLIEVAVYKHADPRPESYRVKEDSLQIIKKGSTLSPEAKVRLWSPFISESLDTLEEERRATKRSLGIIRPDPGLVCFYCKPANKASDEDRESAEWVYQQVALFDEPLAKLKKEYVFYYRYTSNGRERNGQILDWEVQPTYFNYRKRYGDEALGKMIQAYQELLPEQTLHFFMGTIKNHPHIFSIVGLLRSKYDPADLSKQGALF